MEKGRWKTFENKLGLFSKHCFLFCSFVCLFLCFLAYQNGNFYREKAKITSKKIGIGEFSYALAHQVLGLSANKTEEM